MFHLQFDFGLGSIELIERRHQRPVVLPRELVSSVYHILNGV